MKNITKKIILSCAAGLLLVSCDLNRDSQDLIPLDKALSSVEGAMQWDNGMMSSLRPRLFGSGAILPQEAQADMLNAHFASSASTFTSFHSWKSLKSSDVILDELYLSYYAALADVNIFLDKRASIPVDNANKEAEEATLTRIAGHAHFARAFYYFNLTMRWGIPYNDATKDTDLSVPYFDSYRPLEKRGRATNAEVWSSILKDIDLAISELKDVPLVEGSNLLNSDVAKALKSRVLLYMNNMLEALKVAQELIDGGRYPLIAQAAGVAPEDDEFRLMWHEDSGKEQIFQAYINKPDEIGATLDLYGADQATSDYFREQTGREFEFNKPPYLPSKWLFTELYDMEHDRRVPVYFEAVFTSTNNENLSPNRVYVVSKFKGNPKFKDLDSRLWGGYVPNGFQAGKPFRIAEQYLIAAEAANEIGQNELAMKYLNELRSSRGLDPVGAMNLKKDIREERMRELAFEGFRLWDLRRWGEGMRRHDPQNPRFLNKDFDVNFVVPANDPKFVWAIPANLLKINNKLKEQQNPGWD